MVCIHGCRRDNRIQNPTGSSGNGNFSLRRKSDGMSLEKLIVEVHYSRMGSYTVVLSE